MKDPHFWGRLSYIVCDWLRRANDKLLRRFWIDDFIPERATDTKYGVNVEGTAWVGAIDPYRFVVSVPQKMLHDWRGNPSIERFAIDEAQRTLQMEIAKEKPVG
jgi:hypothetical protein